MPRPSAVQQLTAVPPNSPNPPKLLCNRKEKILNALDQITPTPEVGACRQPQPLPLADVRYTPPPPIPLTFAPHPPPTLAQVDKVIDLITELQTPPKIESKE